MQVNFNPSVNQSSPQFGKLKAIRFTPADDVDLLRSSYSAKKKLLEICDLPMIKKIFEKFNGEILFSASKVDNRYIQDHGMVNVKASILLDINDSEFEKIKKTYKDRAFEETLDYVSFDSIRKSNQVSVGLGYIKTKNGNIENMVKNLVNKIKNNKSLELKNVEQEYATQTSKHLKWYKEDCERCLRDLIPTVYGDSGEGKDLVVAKIKELLDTK